MAAIKNPQFIGVPSDQEVPEFDWQILVTDGHVRRVRLAAWLSRPKVVASAVAVWGIAAAAFFVQPPALFSGAAGAGGQYNWPMPDHRISAEFTPLKFSAQPSIIGNVVGRLDDRLGDFKGTQAAAGLSIDQATQVQSQIGALLSFASGNANETIPQAEADVRSHGSQVLAAPLTVTTPADFVKSLTNQNLAAGVVAVPAQTVADNEQKNQAGANGYIGPVWVAGIVDHQLSVYAAFFNTSSQPQGVFGGDAQGAIVVDCMVLAGPAIGACAAASQSVLDQMLTPQNASEWFGIFNN